MLMKWFGKAVVFWLGITHSVFAAEVVTLDPITVQAQRESYLEEQYSSIVTVNPTGLPVSANITESLSKTAGLDIQQRAILTPKSSQVRIRGLDERRSLILLDGRPLNGTGVMGGQFVDWSSLLSGAWESVEIGKGAFSAKYGNTLGGTINLIPGPPAEESGVDLTTGWKRYDTVQFNANSDIRAGAFASRIGAGWVRTRGNLRNSGAERLNIDTRFYWLLPSEGEIRLSARQMEGKFQMPVLNDPSVVGFDPEYPRSAGSYLAGPGIAFPTGDRHGDQSDYYKNRMELDLSVTTQVKGIDSQLKLYLNDETRTDTIYSYNLGIPVLEREARPDRSWGWLAHFSKSLENHRIRFGADASYQGYGGTENKFILDDYFKRAPMDGSDEADATRYHGLFIDDKWQIFQWLAVYTGIRYEDYFGDRFVDQVSAYSSGGKPMGFEKIPARFDAHAWLPKFGLQIKPRSFLTLFGHVARSTRFPDNPAFYWYYGGYRPEVDPNSDVIRKPLSFEDAIQYEAGIRYTGIAKTSITATYYHYRVNDYIRWIFGYSPSRVVYNVDRVDFRGMELEGKTHIWGPVSVFGNLTWQATQKHGDVLDGANALSDELSELPEWKANFGIAVKWEKAFEARATLRWVDDRQVPYIGDTTAPYAGVSSPDGSRVGMPVTLQTMDAYMVVDLSVQIPIHIGLMNGSVCAGVENLLDESYEEDLNFPAPGRSFSVALNLDF